LTIDLDRISISQAVSTRNFLLAFIMTILYVYLWSCLKRRWMVERRRGGKPIKALWLWIWFAF